MNHTAWMSGYSFEPCETGARVDLAAWFDGLAAGLETI